MGDQAKQGGFFSRELALRLASTVVLIPVVVFLVLKGGLYFKALLIVAALIMAYEWGRLTRLSNTLKAWLTAGSVAACWWVVSMSEPRGMADAMAAFLLAGAAVIGVGSVTEKEPLKWLGGGLAYIGLPILSLALLTLLPSGSAWILWMLIVIWTADSGAYVAGRTLGGPKVAPHISPNKTWAGIFGGMAAGAAAGGIAAAPLGLPEPFYLAMSGAFLALWGQGGDFTESAIKRYFSVKDSGALIPGQGGLLDRADSLVFVAPVVALTLWFLLRNSL